MAKKKDKPKDEPKEEPKPAAPTSEDEDWKPQGDGQLRLDGTTKPDYTIYVKTKAIPYEIQGPKFKLNTTQEGFHNMAAMDDRDALKQKVAAKLKVLPKVHVDDGDFDHAVKDLVAVIKGEKEAERVTVDTKE